MGVILTIITVGIIINAIGINEIAKRRGLSQPWLAFIPLGQQYLLGEILDSIASYRNKQTNFRFIILGIIIFGFIVAGFGETSGLANIVWLASINIYSFLIKAVYFFIYKDYIPKHAIALIIISIFIYCEFIIIFAIRKEVPVSMCFRKDDEYLFEPNKFELKLLWNKYHSQTDLQMESWTEYLSRNFTPKSYNMF